MSDIRHPRTAYRDPSHEPHKIRIERGEFVDQKRGGRIVPYKIYYPVAHAIARLPVIIWSHGLGGSRDGAAFLARFISSHGYVVVHPTHIGTDTSLWEGKPGHPWDAIRKAHISRKVTLARFRDIPFLLDQLPELARLHPEIGAHMDLTRLGMSGHSFGAITTQVMAGQMLGKGRRLYSLREDRFTCGIAYSMSPTYNAGEDPARLYGPIAMPMLYMTGTDDVSPLSGKDYTFRLPIFERAQGPEQHLIVLEGADHMVFSGSRGQLAEYEKIHHHKDIIKVVSLAFWDAYLKEDTQAKAWLTRAGLGSYLQKDGEHEYKP